MPRRRASNTETVEIVNTPEQMYRRDQPPESELDEGRLATSIAEAFAPLASTIVANVAAEHVVPPSVTANTNNNFSTLSRVGSSVEAPLDVDVGHVDREPELGMGVTVLGWAGRFAATIVHMNRPKTKITVQRDRVTMQIGPMHNSVQYERDPDGIRTTFTKRRNGAWIREKKYFGNGTTELWVGTRHESITVVFERA